MTMQRYVRATREGLKLEVTVPLLQDFFEKTVLRGVELIM